MFCKSNGLRLAHLPSSGDLFDFNLDIDSYNERIIVDGAPGSSDASECSFVDAQSSTKLLISISCTNETFKFLCQTDLESDENLVDNEFSTTKADNALEFLLPIGSYGESKKLRFFKIPLMNFLLSSRCPDERKFKEILHEWLRPSAVNIRWSEALS